MAAVASTFRFTSRDGTSMRGWRNDGDGVPVVVSPGLGTPPEAWPGLGQPGCGYRVATWYYRGSMGSDRPADPGRLKVADHVADLVACLDHEGMEQAVVVCWSMGVNIAFEAALAYPDRVAGVLAVAGVPGGTFGAMFGPLHVPRRLRRPLGVGAARLAQMVAPAVNVVAHALPVTRPTALAISHSGFMLPAARPEVAVPALREFFTHDFRWYFRLGLEMSAHERMDLSFVRVPVTLLAGRWDVLTSLADMRETAAQLPHARLVVYPGSHFLPLEYPDQMVGQLGQLVARTRLEGRRSPAAAG